MITDSEIKSQLQILEKKYGKVYSPLKYFRGLSTAAQVETRYKKMLEESYAPFQTDKGVKTFTSSYTKRFHEKYPKARNLEDIAKVTEIDLKTIKTIFDRGLAAWASGHRPGSTAHQWAYARVHSFVMKGKTYYTSDSDLVKKGKNESKKKTKETHVEN